MNDSEISDTLKLQFIQVQFRKLIDNLTFMGFPLPGKEDLVTIYSSIGMLAEIIEKLVDAREEK